VWRFAVRTFALERDAHASPLNAVLPLYDSLAHLGPVRGARYWMNPAYGGHCGAIGSALSRYVWQQGCTVVALLPVLVNQPWWHEFVMRAHDIYYLRCKLKFANPIFDMTTGVYFYSYALVVWRETCATEPPRWHPLAPVDDGESPELLRVRRCSACGKYRLLPRHQPEPADPFVCSVIADPARASCGAPHMVWRWDA